MSGASLRGHLAIMRADHWFKNVFVLPGTAVALSMVPAPDLVLAAQRLLLGLVSICLTASSYYTLNELLDAQFDRFHPEKRLRPVPSGQVNVPLGYVQWLCLGVVSIALGRWVSLPFALNLTALWVMGCLYNVPPIRTKDVAYLDVLSESLNNPLRMLAGWYVVVTDSSLPPPASLLMAYWMIGGFFMALKRYAEYRSIGDKQLAISYRKSFRRYDDAKLLTSSVFYASASMLCLGAFMMRYRLELLLAFPALGTVVAAYFRLGLEKNSPVQTPEKLYRDVPLMAAVILCCAVLTGLMFYDVPVLYELLAPQLSPASER
jgi:decaprenyl-phosphate phosphoribosyltransferase